MIFCLISYKLNSVFQITHPQMWDYPKRVIYPLIGNHWIRVSSGSKSKYVRVVTYCLLSEKKNVYIAIMSLHWAIDNHLKEDWTQKFRSGHNFLEAMKCPKNQNYLADWCNYIKNEQIMGIIERMLHQGELPKQSNS